MGSEPKLVLVKNGRSFKRELDNPKLKFLDPACKSGVFLREIAKRLMVGLEKKMEDDNDRKRKYPD